MSRATPFRRKPPEGFLELMEEAASSTFYLVQECGPTCFMIKDPEGKKFKVFIGTQHRCTCGGGASEHCIHTLFVLLKILRVPSDNPIVWQLSLVDSEITELISGRFRSRPRPEPVKKPDPAELPASDKARVVNRMELSEDNICPICQDDMTDLTTLTFCRRGCGHNIHTHCMKVWADHRQAVGDDITCPMCRTDWGPLAWDNLRREDLKVKAKQRSTIAHHTGVKCGRCSQRPIRGPRYHCMLCESFDLCASCFFASVHMQHRLFLVRRTRDSVWMPAPRNGDSRIPQHLARDLQSRDLSAADYETLLSLDQPESLDSFLMSHLSFATRDQVSQRCVVCHAGKSSPLKYLRCGHIAHEECLVPLLRDLNLQCPEDSVHMFVGWHSANSVSAPVEPAPVDNAQQQQVVVPPQSIFISGTAVAQPASQRASDNGTRLPPLAQRRRSAPSSEQVSLTAVGVTALRVGGSQVTTPAHSPPRVPVKQSSVRMQPRRVTPARSESPRELRLEGGVLGELDPTFTSNRQASRVAPDPAPRRRAPSLTRGRSVDSQARSAVSIQPNPSVTPSFELRATRLAAAETA